MTTSRSEHDTEALATSVDFTDRELVVQLADGRRLMLPLSWYPRLDHGTPAERSNWELIGEGEGIHWPALDEDLSVEGFLSGRRSGESPTSLARWLERRESMGRGQ
jgi:Protein of unknown function (DUF2442)